MLLSMLRNLFFCSLSAITEKKPKLCKIPKTKPPTKSVVRTITVGKTSQITRRSRTLIFDFLILSLNKEVEAVMFVLVTASTPFVFDSSYN